MKKKVLFTATVDSHILNFHTPYLKYFKDNGYEVHVATNGIEKIPYCDVKHTVSFERSPFRLNNLKARKQLKKIIDTEQFEIIHTHTPMGSVVTRLAALNARKKFNTRVIYTAHGFHFYDGAPVQNWLLFYPVEKYLARYTDTLITINQEDYQRAKKKFKTRVEYVPGVGVDENKFNFKMTNSEKSELKKSLGLNDTDFVLIYVAELNKNKNQTMLIGCMAEVLKDNKDVHLLLPGTDSYKGRHRKQVHKLGLEDNVHFLGFRADVPKLLKISNLAVSVSNREGLGLNIVEALYSGLPCMVSKNRGHNDIISADNSSFVLSFSDKKDFVNKTNYFYKKSFFYTSIISNGISSYSLTNTLTSMANIYRISNYKPSRCVFIHDFKFYEHKGVVYGPGQFGFDSLWKDKFLSIFDELDVVARGYEVKNLNKIKDNNSRIDGKGVNFISTKSLSSIAGLSNLKEVRAIISKTVKDSDLVVVRLPSLHGIVACGILRKLNQPYIVEVVGNSFESYWYYGSFAAKLMSLPYHVLTRHAVKNANNVIYVTKKYLQEIYPNNSNNIFCSSVKIDSTSQEVLNKRLRKIKKYNINQHFKLGLVGPYNLAYKGHKDAIAAVSLLKNSDKNIELHLLGGGSNVKLQHLAEKSNVTDIINFDKPRSAGKEMHTWLDGIDVLLVPSKTEGLPRIMLEGMSRGLPIIAFNTGDIQNILSANSIIHRKLGPKALSAKILSYLSYPIGLSECAMDNYDRTVEFNYKYQLKKRAYFIEDVLEREKASSLKKPVRVKK